MDPETPPSYVHGMKAPRAALALVVVLYAAPAARRRQPGARATLARPAKPDRQTERQERIHRAAPAAARAAQRGRAVPTVARPARREVVARLAPEAATREGR